MPTSSLLQHTLFVAGLVLVSTSCNDGDDGGPDVPSPQERCASAQSQEACAAIEFNAAMGQTLQCVWETSAPVSLAQGMCTIGESVHRCTYEANIDDSCESLRLVCGNASTPMSVSLSPSGPELTFGEWCKVPEDPQDLDGDGVITYRCSGQAGEQRECACGCEFLAREMSGA